MKKNKLFEAAKEIQNFFLKNNIKFCFIGGIAVLRWGELRITNDVDVCVLSGFGNEQKIIRPILNNFPSRIDNPEEFSLKHRVLLIKTEDNIPIDITLSGIPFEENMIKNASFYKFTENYTLLTCSAEDLIIMKSFANRFKDWADVEGIIIRQGKRLDFDYIFSNLKELCALKNEPEILTILKNLKEKYIK